MIKPIEALADCIMRFEGWYPPASNVGGARGSTSWRNRNPGNLRPSSPTQLKDDKNYRIFDSLDEGYGALVLDLEAKIIHGSHSITDYSTLFELFSIYAPPTDQNDPQHYARTIALWLSQIYNSQITPDITMSNLMELGK